MGEHEQQAGPQSQSQAGPTNENPNEDRENGTQSTIQPGGQGDATTSTGGASTEQGGNQ